MAKNLQTIAVSAPGFFGLNTQESGVQIAPEFALQAENCVIDKFGRLGSRKGWLTRTSKLDGVTDDNVGVGLTGISEFVDVTGTNTYFSWNSTSFFKNIDDLTTLTPTTTDTISDGNWQAVTLNDRLYLFQRGYKPLYYTNETTADEFKSIDNEAGATGTPPLANCVISAYGRLWAADTPTDKTIVYFTDVLEGSKWGSGTAGTLNISAALPDGNDEIVALGAHNGYLIIFCYNHIVIYGDSDNFEGSISTTSLTLVEVIEGTGCIARDSVQNTGEDILFLSWDGVKSLNRTVQEKSQPIRDISYNIRDDVIQRVEAESDLGLIKSVYSPRDAFYLLTFPSNNKIYCFDTRKPMQDGTYRVTEWLNLAHKGFVAYKDKLYIAQEDGIAEYFGYTDNGSSYRMIYFTTYFDLEAINVTKIAKRLSATLIGATGQDFIMKIGYDYDTQYRAFPFSVTQGTVYEYSSSGDNLAEYSDGLNLAEYSGGLLIEQISSPAAGAGTTLQIGFESEVNGAPLSLQRISIYVKQGKMI